MTAQRDAEVFLAKAEEALASAAGDFASNRFNSCANRSYYACFQAATSALLTMGVDARSHRAVQALFARELVNRRKMYSGNMSSVLPMLTTLRQTADYRPDHVTRGEASRALAHAGHFVDEILARRRRSP